MPGTKRILITGAAGTVGQRLSAAFNARGDTVIGIDRPGSGAGIIEADLAQWSEAWVAHFDGVDAVIHLAADPWPYASWGSLQALNMDLAFNVYAAAARSGRKRLILASTNWVMAGYRADEGPITPAMEPFPINGYGATKLMAERLGHHYAARGLLSVVCLRIGMAERPGGTTPGPATPDALWGQQMWLSNRDLVQGFTKAVDASADLDFAVVNLMSANEGSRWDLEATRATLGYVPEDCHPRFAAPEIEARERRAGALTKEGAEALMRVSKGEY